MMFSPSLHLFSMVIVDSPVDDLFFSLLVNEYIHAFIGTTNVSDICRVGCGRIVLSSIGWQCVSTFSQPTGFFPRCSFVKSIRISLFGMKTFFIVGRFSLDQYGLTFLLSECCQSCAVNGVIHGFPSSFYVVAGY